MSRSTHERLEALQSKIEELKQDQEEYSAIKALAESAPNLLNVDALLRTNKKKAKDLMHRINTNKAILKDVKASLVTYDLRVKNLVEANVHQRDKKTKFLENKVNNLETTFKQLEYDNEVLENNLEGKVKEEVQAGLMLINSQLDGQIKDVNKKIKENMEDVEKASRKLIGDSQDIINSLRQFDYERGEFIHKMLMKGRASDISKFDGKKNLANWLLDESHSALSKRIGSIQSSFEARFKALNVAYSQELASIRADIEEVRDSLSRTTDQGAKPETQLESSIQSIRSLLNSLAAASATNLSDLRNKLAEHTQGLTEIATTNAPGDAVLLKGHLCSLKDTVDEMVDKLNADFFVLDDMVKKSLVQSKSLKKAKAQKNFERIKNLEKEASMCRSGIRAKYDTFREELDSLETKLYLVIKQITKARKEDSAHGDEGEPSSILLNSMNIDLSQDEVSRSIDTLREA